MDLEDAVRSGRLGHVTQEAGEVGLVFLLRHAQMRLGDHFAERQRWRKLVLPAVEYRAHFLQYDGECGVVLDHVVELKNGMQVLPFVRFGDVQAHQRRRTQVHHGGTGRQQPLHHGSARLRPEGDDGDLGVTQHDLDGLCDSFPEDGGAQDVVPVDHFLQRRTETVEPFPGVEAKHHRQYVDVVATAGGHEVVEQNAFLQRRQRVHVRDVGHAARNLGEDRLHLLRAQVDQGQHVGSDRHRVRRDEVGGHRHRGAPGRRRQTGHGRGGEQGPYVDRHAAFTETLHQGDAQQGVSAEGEEVVVDADGGVDAEDLAEEGAQELFAGVAWGAIRAGARGRVGCGEGFAVEFAVRGEGKCLQLDIGGGDHVVGQVRTEEEEVWYGVGFGDVVGDEAVVADQDRGLGDTGQVGEMGLDLTELNPLTTDLDLVVGTTQIPQLTIGSPSGDIAGAIHTRTRNTVRVGQESLGRQVGTLNITASQLHTGEIEITGSTRGDRPKTLIQHVDAGVPHRPADSDRRIARKTRRISDIDGSLSGAI
ncbi:putative Dimodular nonribosomal peptide synthase [Streptomyces afghaniensis 772]|uniref:Putative Dimodular nonribosomal peptide synthase n=1 Tax=Streptomyces afghaniensis 772 TaxID=1283301 RepID=S4NCU1_9ACTN|nr:putative Dimodular nonribosomal peptide synthase [Streptomyces afghaniensis 772]